MHVKVAQRASVLLAIVVLVALACTSFGLAKRSFGGAKRAALDRGSCASPCDALPVRELICARCLRRLSETASAKLASVDRLASNAASFHKRGKHSRRASLLDTASKRLDFTL